MQYSEMTALIVDDDSDVRAFLRSTLRSLFGCNLMEASSGDVALSLYDKNKVDLVFLDIQMPGKSGLAILNELKELDQQVKVIMVSAHGTMENVSQAVNQGARGFILKPFHMQKIKAMVEKVHGNRETAH
ncbi:response regulator [Bowmanella dokdonensis]|uniref:Response regulator n=1 Tax=Bowmanella dokdonensis TaxID=751969 RepID=A0A939DNB1_9ALTE|nr:response regulator [Bowmanella dokdonensis]MBN7825372.1 response regulator [Bowmanella dokdonensis]